MGGGIASIRIEPLGVTVPATPGQTVMEAARAAGYRWPTTCGGIGECATCAGDVLSGGESLSPRGRSEEREIVRQRGRGALATPTRLCCQARVESADDVTIVVRKPGVRPEA